jgi:hypothetical protein
MIANADGFVSGRAGCRRYPSIVVPRPEFRQRPKFIYDRERASCGVVLRSCAANHLCCCCNTVGRIDGAGPPQVPPSIFRPPRRGGACHVGGPLFPFSPSSRDWRVSCRRRLGALRVIDVATRWLPRMPPPTATRRVPRVPSRLHPSPLGGPICRMYTVRNSHHSYLDGAPPRRMRVHLFSWSK